MILNIDGLKIACGLDWFKTPSGMFALGICALASFIGFFILKDVLDAEKEMRRFLTDREKRWRKQ